MAKCSVDGCNGSVASKGWCMKHYTRWRRHGDPSKISRSPPSFSHPPVCQYESCGKPSKTRGYCATHYTRLIRHGSAGVTKRAGNGVPMQWIKDRLTHRGEECLSWPFATGGRGDAVVFHKGSMRSASRVMCEMAHGMPGSDDLECAHNCGKGHLGCMNPEHLRWDTKSGNFSDKIIHGTDGRGSKNPRAKLRESEVREILKSNESNRILGDRFGVHLATISAVRNRKNWSHLED